MNEMQEREPADWSSCNNTNEFGPIKVLALPCVLESERITAYLQYRRGDPNLSHLNLFRPSINL
jgi:hypothetical protein